MNKLEVQEKLESLLSDAIDRGDSMTSDRLMGLMDEVVILKDGDVDGILRIITEIDELPIHN